MRTADPTADGMLPSSCIKDDADASVPATRCNAGTYGGGGIGRVAVADSNLVGEMEFVSFDIETWCDEVICSDEVGD